MGSRVLRSFGRLISLLLLALLALGCGGPRVEARGPTGGGPGHAAEPEAALPAWASADAKATWQTFRQTYPFHIQAVAVGQAKDGWRILIVSEPPPSLTLAEIRAATRGVLAGLDTQSNPVGVAGWVRDVVALVKEDDLPRAVEDLHVLLFGTSYKAYALDLPRPAPREPRWNLDLDVPADQIEAWLVAQKMPLVHTVDRSVNTIAGVRANRRPAVYIGLEHAVVGWWIPASVDLADCRAESRMFALDSDLVIGAMGTREGLLILGRERQTPIDRLPPLRFETVRLLASARTGHLAQSYERNHILAGRLRPKEDWAPIMLSPELEDTEYGSLLNVTDQILKSWTNSGLTRYANFPYRDPAKWPFSAPLPTLVKGSSLTYNWNTHGNGHSLESKDGGAVMGFRHTGALPVTYLAEGTSTGPADVASTAVVQQEDTAYRYFAGLGDPNLVRVAQYASLYQIFTRFQPRATAAGPVPADTPLETRRALLREILAEIRASTPEATTRLLDAVAALVVDIELVHEIPEIDALVKAKMDQQIKETGARLTPERRDQLEKQFIAAVRKELVERTTTETRQRLARDHAALKEALGKLDDAQLTAFSIALDAPRDANGVAVREQWRSIVQPVAAYKQTHDRYSKSVAATSTSWIHTPVVVLSNNLAALASGQGGHNLDGEVTGVRLDPAAPKGRLSELETGGKRLLVVHPSDAARVPAIARVLERQYPSLQVQQAALKAAFDAPPPPKVALADVLHAPAKRPADLAPRGFNPPARSVVPEEGVRAFGWRHAPADPPRAAARSDVPASDRAVAAREIRVESQADGTFLAVHADTGARELLPTYRLLADHLHATAWQGTSPVEVVLVGWESHKAAAIEGMMRGRPRSDRAPIHVLSSSREVAGGPIEEPRLTLGAAVRTVSASTRDVTIEIPTGQGVSTMHVTAESGEIAPAEVEPIRGVVESTIREGQKDGITPRQLQEKTRTNLKKLDRKYNVDEHHKAQGLDFYHGARDTVRHDAAA